MESWQELYLGAILESDNSQMLGRIDFACRAIKARLHELSQDHLGSPEERQSLVNAIAALDVLRAERVR